MSLYPNMDDKLQMISCFIHQEVSNIDEFCSKLKVPNEYKDLAKLLNQSRSSIENYEPNTEGYDHLLDIIKKIDPRKKDRLNNFFEILTYEGNKRKIDFLRLFIEKLNKFKLDKEDYKKSNVQIKNIIENSHREIAKEHIKEYLNDK